MDDLELLKAYLDHRDQDAFVQLVRRHGNWLYSASRRQVRDGQLAEDATQAVFLLLARRAGRLRGHTYLSGWLFRAMEYCTREMRRQRARSERREQEAAMMRPEKIEAETGWEAIGPELEGALSRLGGKDRDAVLLRFYEQKSLAEVGRLMGISEEAAQKRVERAVARLREALAAKGVETKAASLAGLVLAHAAEGMEGGPVGLVEKVMAGMNGGVGNGTAGAIAKGAEKMMVWAKVKVVAVVVTVAGALFVCMAQVVADRPTPVSSASAPSSASSGDAAFLSLTKGDLRVAIEANFNAIHDLSVSFREINKTPASDEAALTHTSYTVAGTKMHAVVERMKDAAIPQQLTRREVAYNGQVTTIRPSELRALVSSRREAETLTGANTFCNLMMLHRGWEDDPDAGHPNSLVSIARAAATTLRAEIEMVDGHPCRVLDSYERDRLVESVWLDCRRGFLPLRQRFFVGRGSTQSLTMEYEVTEAVQVKTIWFATRGRRVTYPWPARFPNEHAPTRVSEQTIIVDRLADGTYAIVVNQSLPDDRFDLQKRLPAGTLLLYTDANVPIRFPVPAEQIESYTLLMRGLQ